MATSKKKGTSVATSKKKVTSVAAGTQKGPSVNPAPAPINTASGIGSNRAATLDQLSLANGMTAGYGVQDGHTSNPKLAANSYGGKHAWSGSLSRVGVLRNVPGSLGPNQNYALYFRFNPSSISVSFNTNNQAPPPQYVYNTGTTNPNAVIIPNLASSQTVGWTLFFDRTFEMMKDPLDRGVLKDVAMLYNILGTFESAGAVPISSPVQVMFGKTKGPNNAGQIWGFTGFISSVDIEYGIFKKNMIPSNCTVNLTLTCTYTGTIPGAGGGGSGSGAPVQKTAKPAKPSPSSPGLAGYAP